MSTAQRPPKQVIRQVGLIGINLFTSQVQRSSYQNLETSRIDAFVPGQKTPGYFVKQAESARLDLLG